MRGRAYGYVLTMAAVALSWVVGMPLVYGDYILEDFESYNISGLPSGVVEGANYLSGGGDLSIHHIGPTWNRFGPAVADGVFVSNRSDEVLSGDQSGTFFTDWGQNNWASAVYLLDGMDVTTYSGYRIDVRSNGTTGQQGAGVVATFSGTVDGQSQVWIADLTKVSPQSMTGSVQTYEFDFNPDQFEEVNGFAWEANFLSSLSSLDWIGIQILKQSAIGEEDFSIDNLALKPEPSSAILLIGGVLFFLARRRLCIL